MRNVRSTGFIVVACVLALSACAPQVLHRPVPEAQLSKATVQGFPKEIRFWADEAPAYFENVVRDRIEEYRARNAAYFHEHGKYPPLHYLAISGGAYDGAFGAGLLTGWTQSGERPSFALVTGVSAGALIAPFAYLGPKYDAQLKELFTRTSSDNIFIADVWGAVAGVVRGTALTDTKPLAEKIEQAITPAMLKEIAENYKQGRLLLMATTNMEAQRGVIWDIGRIAASGHPGSLNLVHQIMLASASVPGLFPPVMIDVEAGGEHYNEIHVDGGTTSQVFAYPMRLSRSTVQNIKKGGLERHLYIVRNGKISPEYLAMQPGVLSLARRSVETLIKYQGLGDLYRLYVSTQRDGLSYHMVGIPDTFQVETKELFDPDYMGKLFEVGYGIGQKAENWMDSPPGVPYRDTEGHKMIRSPGPGVTRKE
ncbi:MAG: hypothetical protein EBV03_05560 [Proteobacteria bacterium]|nr:hypothetical protein [Pseudomonadota bacterium]